MAAPSRSNPHSRRPAPGSSEFSGSLSLSSYLRPLLPIVLLESSFTTKKDQLHNGRRGPFLLSPSLFSHSFLKLSDRAGLFNLPEPFRMSLTSDGGDNGTTSSLNAWRAECLWLL